MTRILFLVICGLIFVLNGVRVQAAVPESNIIQEALQITPQIEIYLSQNGDDIKEPKRKNIFTIHVVYPSDYQGNTESRYRILFYLDGRVDIKFENQGLPLTFAQNFRGQLPGRHEIRIDLEDLAGLNVLATKTIAVEVIGE